MAIEFADNRRLVRVMTPAYSTQEFFLCECVSSCPLPLPPNSRVMILSIALGSAFGGVARHLIGVVIQRLQPGPFPYATLLVNIVGSLALGFLLPYALRTPGFSPSLRAGLTIGFCGGFTTFSTFSIEVVGLIDAGDYRRAALYVALSVGLSVLAAAAGFALARGLVPPPFLSE